MEEVPQEAVEPGDLDALAVRAEAGHLPTRRLQAHALLCAAALVLAACRHAPAPVASAPPEGAPRYGNERGRAAAAPVAVIDGRILTKGALSDYWFHRYPQEYGRTLDALVDEHLVRLRAQPAGLVVPAAALDAAIRAEVAARRKQIEATYGQGASLASEVQRVYGMDVEAWKVRVLRPRLHAKLLMERVIRWDTRRRARVHARVIVLDDPDRAAKVMAKLRRGADFSLTAARESKDPSARSGGDLPSIARGDLAVPGVEQRLFQARPGQLVGPLEVRVDGRPQWQVYKVVEHTPAWQGDPATLRARLEDDLRAHPVTGGEFERWRARVHREAGVRYYAPDGRLWTPRR